MTSPNRDLRSPLPRSFKANWDARLWLSFHTAVPDSYSCLFTPDPTSEPLRTANSKNKTVTVPQFQSIFPMITVLERNTGGVPGLSAILTRPPLWCQLLTQPGSAVMHSLCSPSSKGTGREDYSRPLVPSASREWRARELLAQVPPRHQANSLRR